MWAGLGGGAGGVGTQDGKPVRIGFGKDPGQAGKSQALHLVRPLSGFTLTSALESGDKLTRFGPFSSQCHSTNVHWISRTKRAPSPKRQEDRMSFETISLLLSWLELGRYWRSCSALATPSS